MNQWTDTDTLMDELAAALSGSAPESRNRMYCISLAIREIEGIARLDGFKKKTHRVPDEINSRTQSFVGKLSAKQVADDLDQVFGELRSAFRFKRKELQSDNGGEGTGLISTPYFQYCSTVSQNPEDASEVIWRRDISQITEPNQLLSDGFAAVFSNFFDTVEFTPPTAIDLEALIDRIEETDDDRFSLEYDRQLTFCEIWIEGTAAKLHVTPEAIRIMHPQPQPPRVLIASLIEVQNALVEFSTLSMEPE